MLVDPSIFNKIFEVGVNALIIICVGSAVFLIIYNKLGGR